MTPREILDRPFPRELVRQRPGRNGEHITYLEGHVVVGRLIEAFDGDWSFAIESHQILEDEVIVLGTLTAGGVRKSAFGSSAITRPRDGGKPVSLGDDLKAAATDSLKKGATLLGVGLQLHVQMQTDTPPTARRGPEALQQSPAPRDNKLLSGAQLRALHAIRRRLGWSESDLSDFAKTQAGIADVEQLDKRAASALIESLQGKDAPAGAHR